MGEIVGEIVGEVIGEIRSIVSGSVLLLCLGV